MHPGRNPLSSRWYDESPFLQFSGHTAAELTKAAGGRRFHVRPSLGPYSKKEICKMLVLVLGLGLTAALVLGASRKPAPVRVEEAGRGKATT